MQIDGQHYHPNGNVLTKPERIEPASGFRPFRIQKPKPQPKITVTPKPEPEPPDETPPSLVVFHQSVQKRLSHTLPPLEKVGSDFGLNRGRMIRCRIVNAIDSGSLQTPIIATTTEPVYHLGKLVIPLNSQVHGSASQAIAEDRLGTNSQWVIILRDGKEVEVQAMALTREFNAQTGRYGSVDGSAGIRGVRIEDGKEQDWKILTASGIGALSKATKKYENGLLGSFSGFSTRNLGIDTGSSAIDQYAKRLEQEARESEAIVKVPAGTEFYLYYLGLKASSNTITNQQSSPATTRQILSQRAVLMDQLRKPLNETRRGQ